MHKNYLVIILSLLLTAGCSHQRKPLNPSAVDGAYSITSQNFKGATSDTTYTNTKQLKIYTEGYMMFVGVNAADSAGSFGVGTFTLDGNKLTENIVYSALNNTYNSSSFSTTADITKNSNGYKQVIAGIQTDSGKVTLTEQYTALANTATSALDGAWKQVSGYSFNSKDTVFWNDVQYKAFYGGNFVYGNYAEAGPNKKQTYASYGAFSVVNDTLMNETITASNIPALIGKNFSIHITFNGEDNYTETHQAITGQTEVIVYQRMKR